MDWFIQSICYNLVWFFCIKSATSPHRTRLLTISWLLFLFQSYLAYPEFLGVNILLYLGLALIGYILSALPIYIHWASYPGPENGFRRYFPLWLGLIWASFMLFILPLVQKYHDFPLLVALIIGFGFALAYYYGYKQKALLCLKQKGRVFSLIGASQGIFFYGIAQWMGTGTYFSYFHLL